MERFHINVLMIEDSQDDVLLLVREIQQNGYEVNYRQVETAIEMENALDQEKWDIITSDYSMPHFSGLDALNLLKSKNLDIPFILISGVIGEEIAVNAIKAGANDYIMKDNLNRLIPTIQREINEAEVRRQRKLIDLKLKESEIKYRQIFDSSPSALVVIDLKGTIQDCNPKACEYFILSSKEDCLAKNLVLNFPEDLQSLFNNTVLSIISTQEEYTIEYKFPFENESRWYSTHMFLEFDQNGFIKSIVQITQDITDHKKVVEHLQLKEEELQDKVSQHAHELVITNKRLEEEISEHKEKEDSLRASEAKYRQLINSMQEGLWIIDRNGYTTFVNPRMAQMLGYTEEEMLGKSVFTFVDEKMLSKAKEYLMRKMQGVSEQFEFPYIRKDGSQVDFLLETSPLYDNQDNFIGSLRCLTDITKFKEKEAQLTATFEQKAIGIAHMTMDGQYTLVNQRFCEIVGYTPDELLGMHLQDLLHPDELPQLNKNFDQANAGEDQLNSMERRYIRKDGKLIWVRGSLAIVKDNSETPRVIIAMIEDITSQKEREEIVNLQNKKIEEEEIQLQATFEQNEIGIIYLSKDGNFLRANEKYCEIIGYSEQELLEMNIQDLIKTEEQYQLAEKFDRFNQGEKQNNIVERQQIRKDGTLIWIKGHTTIVNNANGDFLYYITFIEDINEQKMVKDTIFEQNIELSAFFNESPLGIFTLDTEENFLRVNPKFCDLLEYSEQELLQMNYSQISLPEDQSNISDHVLKLNDGNQVQISTERQFKRKDQSFIWVLGSCVRIIDKNDQTKYLLAMVLDITQQKYAESLILKQTKQLQSMFNQSGIGIVFSDMDGNLLQVNPKFCNMLDYTEDELQGQSYRIFIDPEYIAAAENTLNRLYEGELQIGPFERHFLQKNGNGLWVSIFHSLVKNERGDPDYYVSFITDITDQKQAAEIIQEKSEEVQAIFNQEGLGIIISDLDGKYLQVNPKLCTDLGYSEDELIGQDYHKILIPDQESSGDKVIAQLKEGKMSTPIIEHGLLRKDGTIMWTNIFPSIVKDENENPKFFVSFILDITEQKLILEKLSDQSKLLQMILGRKAAGNEDSTSTLSEQEKFNAEYITSSLSLMRQRAEGIIGSQPKDIENLSVDNFKYLSHELEVHQIELEFQNENLREAQLELEKAREKYANLYNYAPIGYLTLNKKLEITDANYTAIDLLEIDKNLLISTLIYRIVPSHYQGQLNEIIKNLSEDSGPQYLNIPLKKHDGTEFDVSIKLIKNSKVLEEIQYLFTFFDLNSSRESQELEEKKSESA